MPFPDDEVQRIAEAATPDALVSAPPEAWEGARRIAEAALDRYTVEDWRYVLNALRPERAAKYISRRPAERRSELVSLIESPSRRAAVKRHLLVATA